MHESVPKAPDPEQLLAALLTEHGAAQIEESGMELSLDDFSKMADVLCPVPADQRSPEQNLSFLGNLLVKNKVQLDDKYLPYISEVLVNTADTDKPDNRIPKTETPKSAIVKKPETTESQPERSAIKVDNIEKIVAEITAPDTQPEKPNKTTSIIRIIQKDAMSKTVALVPVTEKEDFARQAITELELTPELETAPQTKVEPVTITAEAVPEVEHIDAPVVRPEIPTIFDETASLSAEIQAVETTAPTEAVYYEPVEIAIESEVAPTGVFEMPATELHETEFSPLDLPVVHAGGPIFEASPEDTVSVRSGTKETTVSTLPEADSDLNYVLEPFNQNLTELAPEAQQPTIVTTEFLEQVLPFVAAEVTERLIAMEPEAIVEVASRVEMIILVADRLHELTVSGNSEGEEGRQIEAFLRREYEQVLLTVGIEPTEEMLERFINMIQADDYKLRLVTTGYYEEIDDEGTHEKKIFDEQSVFTKAHLASVSIGQKIGNNIGRILVQNLAS